MITPNEIGLGFMIVLILLAIAIVLFMIGMIGGWW